MAPADALVVFGITGDLAKVMTFRALYRLEARGLLDAPSPVQPYPKGSSGPTAADALLTGQARWHGPWIAS